MQNKAKYLFWGKAFLCALLLVFVVRTFWVESYLISSTQMEDALQEGDRVIVNKTAYGLRLPMTLLSVPFTFDQFLGVQSYSSLVELPYKRIGCQKIPLNDVVVYNNPLQADRPLDKRMLCVGRCVARPGDTMSIDGFDLKVNGHKYEPSPDYRLEYTLPAQWQDSLRSIFKKLSVSDKTIKIEGSRLLFSANRLESYLIREYIPDSLLKSLGAPQNAKIQLVIPRKGSVVRLTPSNLRVYAYLILQEHGRKAVIQNGKLFIDGKIQEKYSFNDNYYWMLSENQIKAMDSNQLGFIPEKNIVGKASFIWYSFSSKGFSWSRFFSRVN